MVSVTSRAAAVETVSLIRFGEEPSSLERHADRKLTTEY